METRAIEVGDRVSSLIRGTEKHNPNYPMDLALIGELAMYDATKDSKYLDHVLAVWKFRTGKESPSARHTVDSTYHIDVRFDTWARTGDIRYVERIVKVAREFRDEGPRDRDGAIAQHERKSFPSYRHKKIFVDQLCGYMMLMARAGMFSGDVSFSDECANQAVLFRNILRDPKTGLWHHGRGFHPEEELFLSPIGWGRGQGWVIHGLCESLLSLRPGSRQFSAVLEVFQQLSSDLVRWQGPSGMWHQVVHEHGTYAESSGTALIVHALYRGVTEGWLPAERYKNSAARGLEALLGQINPDGSVRGVCIATGPLRTIEEYQNREHKDGDHHSLGSVMMACAAPMTPKRTFPKFAPILG